MFRKAHTVLVLAGFTSLAGLAVACSSAPPPELVDARAAYQRAAAGPAAQLDPAQLHVAHQSLTVAEKTFEDEGDSDKTRDRAYVATRKAQIAESQARLIASEKATAEMERQSQQALAAGAARTSQELNRTKEQLAAETQKAEAERAARADAEQRAKEATDALARVAAVKQEPRGMVITLSGSVLFASGKSELLPAARAKLNEVADVLAKQASDRKIVVEGHTDSQGALAFNEKLSQDRADAVRSYLVSRNVPADRVTAKGMGPSQPIADNTSPEGRANNRRVEIVVQPSDKQ